MDLRNRQAHSEEAYQPQATGSQAGFVAPTVANKILVILLIIASLLVIFFLSLRLFDATQRSGTNVKSKQYQALFLTNGQVYFGHLDRVDNTYVTLKDIYYLQIQQQVQPKDNTKAADQPQVSLAKLGGELHGPEDVMYIDRSQVLFWENLKGDGKVAKAIADYKATGATK